jgi:phosphoribosyl-AMP cyclohydrolase
VRDIRIDCDGDSVLLLVHADGPACHTGERSCFFTSVEREYES